MSRSMMHGGSSPYEARGDSTAGREEGRKPIPLDEGIGRSVPPVSPPEISLPKNQTGRDDHAQDGDCQRTGAARRVRRFAELASFAYMTCNRSNIGHAGRLLSCRVHVCARQTRYCTGPGGRPKTPKSILSESFNRTRRPQTQHRTWCSSTHRALVGMDARS